MSNFDLLHPALQHQIVSSLGWRALRPFQDELIPKVLAGKNLIVVAPTAGGKTEAAIFPVLSRMLAEQWTGLSVLYVCPIKALLNNLDTRLNRYCTLLGRRSAVWHGDVNQSARKKILKDPPDCLLTTPESLEVMLVSQNVDAQRLLGNVRVVIVDEVHAFAGDDRGWHLLAVLERIARLAGEEFQRIGLSATVGNPEELIDWLAASCAGPREVALPPAGPAVDSPDVQLDYVGSLENAATVIARLHRGEKRLVFVETRSDAEKLASELRRQEVRTFVTHSSLSRDQRHRAEQAFSEQADCVIVATSVLELGVDVGDLHRVIQINAPRTVSSLLQRMGRTGRREGSQRNCLFLCTEEGDLIRAAGLISLWERGYVEPIQPPAAPLHVLAQQIMALVLQNGGLGRSEWEGWVGKMPGFASLSRDQTDDVMEWMLREDILWDDKGILGFGHRGEDEYGRRNFMELLSVFTSPPEFEVLYGRRQIGYVDRQTFETKSDGPKALSLGGRAWFVNYIDWSRRKAYVEPADANARSKWRGGGNAGLGFELCRAMRNVLTSEEVCPRWSTRAVEQLRGLRQQYHWLDPVTTTVTRGVGDHWEWWTFAGRRANASLAREIERRTSHSAKSTDSHIVFETNDQSADLDCLLRGLRETDPASMRPEIDPVVIDGLKFSACLSDTTATAMLELRLQDIPSVRRVQQDEVRFVMCESLE